MKNVLHATSVPRPADHPNGGLLAGTTPGADGRSNRGDGSISVSPLSASAMAEADASRRGDYQAYINRHAWKTSPARMGELEAAGYRCRICNRSVDEVRLEVHHRTYENFGIGDGRPSTESSWCSSSSPTRGVARRGMASPGVAEGEP